MSDNKPDPYPRTRELVTAAADPPKERSLLSQQPSQQPAGTGRASMRTAVARLQPKPEELAKRDDDARQQARGILRRALLRFWRGGGDA